jgi:tyrosyl-tRNA synthetase
MYQFFVNTDDRDVISYLKLFTLLDADQISGQAAEVESNPRARAAQKLLASEVTRLVHGDSGLAAAEAATSVLFGGEVADMSVAQLREIFADVPSSEVARTSVEGDGVSLTRLMADSGVARSAGEARRLVQQGGVSVNNRRATDHAAMITLRDLIEGQLLVIRRGARSYHLIEVAG